MSRGNYHRRRKTKSGKAHRQKSLIPESEGIQVVLPIIATAEETIPKAPWLFDKPLTDPAELPNMSHIGFAHEAKDPHPIRNFFVSAAAIFGLLAGAGAWGLNEEKKAATVALTEAVETRQVTVPFDFFFHRHTLTVCNIEGNVATGTYDLSHPTFNGGKVSAPVAQPR